MCYKNVYVIGVFDLFHRGHIELLKNAKSLGNNLIVAINSDELVSIYKRPPVYSEEDRLAIVKACRFVDDVFIINEFDNKEYLLKYKIDAVIHGSDWELNSYLKQIRVSEEFLQENNIDMVFLPYTSGVSTSSIIEKIKAKV